MTLTETLKKALKLFPMKEAIVCGKDRWTYREFGDRINRLSRYLANCRIEKDDKVALLHPNCHTFLEAYYGIAQIGAISVPINYRLAAERLPSSSRILNRRS